MNIVHVNFSDTIGGASIAAYRHNQAMNKMEDTKSVMMVVDKQRDDKTIYCFVTKFWLQIAKILYLKVSEFIIAISRPQTYFTYSCCSFNLSKLQQLKKADIVIVHWINSMTTSIEGIEQILKLKKPTFLFLHDMWYMTGGCHYSLGCNEYKYTCGGCKEIRSVLNYNIAKIQFKRKHAWRKYSNFRVLAPSKWLCDCAKNSYLLGGIPTFLCRNVIDDSVFSPLDKYACRKEFDIPFGKKIIAFAAASVANPVKGLKYLLECLSLLSDDDFECLIIGKYDRNIENAINQKVRFTGYIIDERVLVKYYNAADILVIPSIAENFPNVVLEGMSCGIPAVGFRIGGIPELILHKQTGFLSDEVSAIGLARGIAWCVDEEHYKILSNNARHTVVENYSYGRAKMIYNFMTTKI